MQNDSSRRGGRESAADDDVLKTSPADDSRELELEVPSRISLQRVTRGRNGAKSSAKQSRRPRQHETAASQPPPLSSTDGGCRPPALLEYYDSEPRKEAVMNKEEEEEENSEAEEESTAAASRISLDHSDISGESDIERDEEEEEEEEEEDFDDCLQEPGSSNGRDSSKHQQSKSEENTSLTKTRKRKRGVDEGCSSTHMCAAEDKHIKESKLKHNKNEQLRRKDLKDAVHRLRNQLRRKTKKPTTISVLKAAIHEIDELTTIKEQEDRELEQLRHTEMFLKYRLESLVSERKNLFTSNEIGSPVQAGVPPFVRTPRTGSPSTPTIPQLANRLTFPHLSVLPIPSPPVPVPTRDPAPPSPSTISRRARPAESQQPDRIIHPHIITPPRLQPLPTLPLPQPPSLIPFTAAATPNPFPSTPPTTSPLQVPPNSIPLLPTLTPSATSPGILPGTSPTVHLRTPWPASSPSGIQPFYRPVFPSPLVMPFPTQLGRLTSIAPTVIGGAGGLTSSHPTARLGMGTTTFPFSFGYLSPTSALHPSMLGAAGIIRLGSNQFGAATPVSQPGRVANVRSMQQSRVPSHHPGHMNGHSATHSASGERSRERSRQSSVDSNDARHRTGSKNGMVSVEAHNSHVSNSVSTAGKKDSAEILQTSSDKCHHFAKDYRNGLPHSSGQGRSNDLYNHRDDNEGITDLPTAKRTRYDDTAFHHRRSALGIPSVLTRPTVVQSTAPPLLKVIDLDEGDSTSETSVDDAHDTSGHGREREVLTNAKRLPQPLKDSAVISTVIKHMKPRRDTVYEEKERASVCEDYRYSRNSGEQRWRVSNSLSSSDECPDSPQHVQRRINGFTGASAVHVHYNRTSEKEREHYCTPGQVIIAGSRDCSPISVGHKNNKTLFRRRKGSHLRHNHNHVIIQPTV